MIGLFEAAEARRDKSMFSVQSLFDDFGVVVEPNGSINIIQLSADEVKTLLWRHGVILFRQFDADDISFKTFSDSLMTAALTHGAKARKAVGTDRTIVEVVSGQADMCLHQELGYVPWSP